MRVPAFPAENPPFRGHAGNYTVGFVELRTQRPPSARSPCRRLKCRNVLPKLLLRSWHEFWSSLVAGGHGYQPKRHALCTKEINVSGAF